MKILILSVLLATMVSAVDYWKECDFNGNGKIDTRKTYKTDGIPKEIAKKETKCRSTKNLAKLDEENARLNEENAKLDKSIKSLKDELKEIDRRIATNEEKLKKQRKWLICKIEYAQLSFAPEGETKIDHEKRVLATKKKEEECKEKPPIFKEERVAR